MDESSRDFVKEHEWENFETCLSSLDREHLVKLLDDEIAHPYQTIADSYQTTSHYRDPWDYRNYHSSIIGMIDPFGIQISDELNGDKRIEFRFQTLIVRKEDLNNFRDYMSKSRYV